MALTRGPNMDVLEHGLQGETHYTEQLRMLRGLDLFLQPRVLSILATPPATPANGDAYIVAASATGAWVGQVDKLARWQTKSAPAAWEFWTPRSGWRVDVVAEAAQYRYSGTAWAIVASGGGGGSTPTGTGFRHVVDGAEAAAAKLVETADVTNAAITLAKQADMATGSVVYRKTASAGPPEVQTLATLKADLGLTGTNSGDQSNITGNAGTATALQSGSADRTKLDGISPGATANSTDAALIARSNHTGTQAASTISDFNAAADARVVRPRVVTALAIASGVVNIDLALGDYFTLALTANVTSITFSNPPAAGYAKDLAIRFTQDATGGRTVALPASFKASGGSDTAVLGTASRATLLTAVSFDQGTRWEYAMQDLAA